MSFLQRTFILFVVILINSINSSTKTIKSTTIESIHQTTISETEKLRSDLKKDENQWKIDREKFEKEKKQISKSVNDIDVIRLNVGGEIIMTTRQTLTRISKSILSIMFNGRWEHKLPMDKNKNIFLDFNPILFRHLLDQLQILKTNNEIHFYPPSQPSLEEPFNKMIRKLRLDQSLSLEKNILTFNVGGQIITNRRTTVTQVSNSSLDPIVLSSQAIKFDNSSDVFLDYDPKLFRYLINQLRENPSKNICLLESSSNEEKISYKRMIKDLNLCRQLFSFMNISINTKWIQNGITIAGGNGQGNQSNQLDWPRGAYVDDDGQRIYVADTVNKRIVEWKWGAKNGQVVAGGKGEGNKADQLNVPIDMIVDKKNDSIIICDGGNRRIVRWPRRNGTNGQTIISNIDCEGLTMDNNGNLYVSDDAKHEVRRWKIGDSNGTIVAGGNGKGDHLNQFNGPTYIFVDQDYSVYVSDYHNQRVMKWMKGAKEGIVVAGGQGQGSSLTQLSYPQGLTVDHLGNVYVTDMWNQRIMRWSKGSREGSIVVGGNMRGGQSNQLSNPAGLSFDRQGNLYVVDFYNHRIQKFNVDF